MNWEEKRKLKLMGYKYQCPICGEMFEKKFLRAKHTWENHRDVSGVVFE